MGAKVYTKGGDKGKTSLVGGKRISKAELRIQAYGNVDELNAFTGALHDNKETTPSQKEQLVWIQNQLFNIGSILASEPDFTKFKLPEITADHVTKLEQWIDEYDALLEPLKNFILPCGHPIISSGHICRTVCRRTERYIVQLNENAPINDNLLKFINRLSDYFFIFVRMKAHELDISEVEWTVG